MPELPEVETVRRGLEPVMAGRRIERLELRRPDLRWPFPEGLAEQAGGQRIKALRRRSKYLLADLESGAVLLIHLGMSGRMLISHDDRTDIPGVFVQGHQPVGKHDHVIFEMEGGARVTFNDPRRFGALDLIPPGGEAGNRLLAGLGPEPLGNAFHEAHLAAAWAGRRMPVKAALLDQRLVAGLGNIYVCEALHRAGISPLTLAGDVDAAGIARLVPAIREVLTEAIAAGGSSLRDYRQADGDLGYFQHAFRVYGREGQPCTRPGCGGTIARIQQSGRSSFHCPSCQPFRPAGGARPNSA